MNKFAEFCMERGVILPAMPIMDSKWHRCGTAGHEGNRNGAYNLTPNGASGAVQNWGTMEKEDIWFRDGIDNTQRTAEDQARDNAALSERLAAKRSDERKATARAKHEYGAAHGLRGAKDESTGMIMPTHDYMRKKRLTMEGAMGIRTDGDGNLIVPMNRDGYLLSIQRISPTGEKKFATGAPSKGAVFWISRPRATVTVLCEGFATGATLFAAVQTSKVCVCFSASNLSYVATREDWSGMVAVAADNDWEKPCHRHQQEGEINQFDPESPRPEWCKCNPGKTAAMKAASIIGCGWAAPKSDAGTDWNDLFVNRLTKFEEQEEFAFRKTSPHKLRERALVPIRAEIMRVARYVGK